MVQYGAKYVVRHIEDVTGCFDNKYEDNEIQCKLTCTLTISIPNTFGTHDIHVFSEHGGGRVVIELVEGGDERSRTNTYIVSK
mgnify:CR=1 FL=1